MTLDRIRNINDLALHQNVTVGHIAAAIAATDPDCTLSTSRIRRILNFDFSIDPRRCELAAIERALVQDVEPS